VSDEPSVRERLAAVAMFQGLDEAELDELTHSAKTKNLDAGEDLIVEGSNSDALYVVLEGNFDVTRLTQGVQLPLGNVDPGEVVGEMAMLERAPRNATVTAVVPSQVVEVPGAAIEKLLNNPAAALAMVRTVTGRLRSTELALRQSQHMKLLGETTALLLHNLNNPAAAARRAAAYLDQAVPRWRGAVAPLELDEVTYLEQVSVRSAAVGLERSRSEQLIRAWLEKRDFPRPSALSDSLVGGGITLADLDGVESTVPADRLQVVVTALAADVEVRGLAAELALTAERVSEVVGAVRRYAHEGRALIPDYEVHRGLEDTLLILGGRLDHIEVVRAFDPELPRIEAFGGKLNQVWTNLVANAVDAMEGIGTLTLRTRAADGEVTVEVIDSGPGIPDEVQPHVFDDFFTTKQLDKGTGLGLPSVKAIVVEHHGTVDFTTRPGSTTFRIVLPTAQPG
jgi:signal transduction histidine kinase